MSTQLTSLILGAAVCATVLGVHRSFAQAMRADRNCWCITEIRPRGGVEHQALINDQQRQWGSQMNSWLSGH